jgi:putative membrane protein
VQINCTRRRRESIKKSFLVFQHALTHFGKAPFAQIMQPQTKQFLRFLKSWLISTLAVMVAVEVVHGIHFHDPGLIPPLLTALVLGILNAFMRPILVIFALPLVILTLGLFMLVINALMLCFVSWLMQPYFVVDTFGAAILGALVISIISFALNILTGNSNARIIINRRPPPSDKKSDKDGNGPVIDV